MCRLLIKEYQDKAPDVAGGVINRFFYLDKVALRVLTSRL